MSLKLPVALGCRKSVDLRQGEGVLKVRILKIVLSLDIRGTCQAAIIKSYRQFLGGGRKGQRLEKAQWTEVVHEKHYFLAQ